MRKAVIECCLLVILVALPVNRVAALSRTEGDSLLALEAASLRSISTWLKQSGRDGYLAAEVADAVGIPRNRSEELLEAKQRGFRNGDVLRIAQVPSDEKRDFLLFMVQRPDGEVYFYLSNVREGLRKAFVSIPGKGVVAPLEAEEAQALFQHEVQYWQDKTALN